MHIKQRGIWTDSCCRYRWPFWDCRKDEMRMFGKGDYVVYGSTGVCRIEDITVMDMEGVPKDRLYYLLCPLGQMGGRIFTPVDNPKAAMRGVLVREEALSLLEDIPEIEEVVVPNIKLREEKYKECARSGDSRDWVKIIKTLYLKRQKRIREGKRLPASDERYLKMAEENLFTELSVVFGETQEEAERRVAERMLAECADKSHQMAEM